MMVSENTLKWALRFYPPLLFQRIWVSKIEKAYRRVDVKIFKSILNLNYNKSIYGGTIASASDPFYAVCLYQILIRKGYKIKIWVKSSKVEYIKPAYTSLYFSIRLNEGEIKEVYEKLDSQAKYTGIFSFDIFNARGERCATINHELYIRKLV